MDQTLGINLEWTKQRIKDLTTEARRYERKGRPVMAKLCRDSVSVYKAYISKDGRGC